MESKFNLAVSKDELTVLKDALYCYRHWLIDSDSEFDYEIKKVSDLLLKLNLLCQS